MRHQQTQNGGRKPDVDSIGGCVRALVAKSAKPMIVPEIAKALGITGAQASVAVAGQIKAGIFVACKVARPPYPPCNEVRMAASAGMPLRVGSFPPPSAPDSVGELPTHGCAPVASAEPVRRGRGRLKTVVASPTAKATVYPDLTTAAVAQAARAPAAATPSPATVTPAPTAPVQPVAETPTPAPVPAVQQQAPFRSHALDVLQPDDRFRAGVFSDGSLAVRNSAGETLELTPDATKRLALYLVRSGLITADTLA